MNPTDRDVFIKRYVDTKYILKKKNLSLSSFVAYQNKANWVFCFSVNIKRMDRETSFLSPKFGIMNNNLVHFGYRNNL